MVQAESMLKPADNTGAKKLKVIKVLGGYKKRYARVGDIVTVSVKEAAPHSMVKKRRRAARSYCTNQKGNPKKKRSLCSI